MQRTVGNIEASLDKPDSLYTSLNADVMIISYELVAVTGSAMGAMSTELRATTGQSPPGPERNDLTGINCRARLPESSTRGARNKSTPDVSPKERACTTQVVQEIRVTRVS